MLMLRDNKTLHEIYMDKSVITVLLKRV